MLGESLQQVAAFGALATTWTTIFLEKYQGWKFLLIGLTTELLILNPPAFLVSQRERTTAGSLVSA